jgi:hypothetical protein
VKGLWASGILSDSQKDIINSQIDVGNFEVIHKLTLSTDEKISDLAGDLLYHQNVLGSIDGGQGSTLRIVQPLVTGDSDTTESGDDSYVVEVPTFKYMML